MGLPLLNIGRRTKKLTPSEQQRRRRLRRQVRPTSSNSINFELLYENGIMHVIDDTYSQSFRLGDVNYDTAPDGQRMDIVENIADAINSLDDGTHYQLLINQKRIEANKFQTLLYDQAEDGNDDYRLEYNQLIKDRMSEDSSSFEVSKTVTISTQALDRGQAKRQLEDMGVGLQENFKASQISIEPLNGLERLKLFNQLLRDQSYLSFDYKDIAISGLKAKQFISPDRIDPMEDYLKIDHRYGKVMFIRNFPSFLPDKLVKKILGTNEEVTISIQAISRPTDKVITELNNENTAAKRRMVRDQRKGAQKGVTGDLAVAGADEETTESTREWKDTIEEADQKVFDGVFTIFFKADSLDELNHMTRKFHQAAKTVGAQFGEVYHHQEDALNTILPIGQVFLDVRRKYLRDMTTLNVATQIPFANVDLQSDSPQARYYGQNQQSNNMITLDRKRDLRNGNGLFIGSSGSGKSMAVKTLEVIPILLKYLQDKLLIIDPDDEYSDIGREFGAEMIELSADSGTHINILDLPDESKLFSEDKKNNAYKKKANLLLILFQTLFKDLSDEDEGLIDRVTRLTYEQYDAPTLREWHMVLSEQPEEEASNLSLKTEPYCTGSQDLFSHPTNVDINNRFVIFNLSKLDGKLKDFAIMVMMDYIWNLVVENRGKETLHLIFDELAFYFATESQANFFVNLYSRVRKYGALPTGITQNPETILGIPAGRKLFGNAEFFVLLKLKDYEIDLLSESIALTQEQVKFIRNPKAPGTGLIVAGDTVVPFENDIPEETKLYQLLNTDA